MGMQLPGGVYRIVAQGTATELECKRLQHSKVCLRPYCADAKVKPGRESHIGKPHMNISHEPNTATKKIQRGCQRWQRLYTYKDDK